MRFQHLQIEGWKQFHKIDLVFHDRLTILTGANGSGKTTLLHLLARHFGWAFSELATPAKDKQSGAIKFFTNLWKRLYQKDEPTDNDVIGKIVYSDGTSSELSIPQIDSALYQLNIHNQKYVVGLNILSHRSAFKYQNIPSITTQKNNRRQVYDNYENSIKQDALSMGSYYVQKPQNYYIKETLLSWAIGGEGNSFIEADKELIDWFKGFEDVLRILMPKNIGFEKISIRNYEIVLVTKSGDFMLDAVSGGIAALVDLGWQIYNLANSEEEIVVLIDEVENHLHATMQRSVLPDLLEAFPNVQFVISTHSPLVVSSVKDSKVYAFRYNLDNRVYSEQLDLVHKARTATEILNEVLGVPFTMPIWAEDALNSIVTKYKSIELTSESVNAMRREFKEAGLEGLMPLALTSVLEND